MKILSIIAVAATLQGALGQVQSPRINSGLAKALLDPALMCLAIYTNAEVAGWKGPAFQHGGMDFRDGPGGLQAGVYVREQPAASGGRIMIMAYRGTESGNIDDWTTDLANVFGLAPEAYLEGTKWAQAAQSQARSAGCEGVVLTGHSLGGGLACYAALQLGRRGYGFGSAALGEGLLKILNQEAPDNVRRAPELVTHVFLQSDPVPSLTGMTGAHPGAIAAPRLTVREDYAGLRSPLQKAAYWAVTGLVTDKWLGSTLQVLSQQVAESHGMDYYLAALAALVAPPDGFEPSGHWSSEGRFFDLASASTQFILSRNGRLRLLNQISVLDQFHKSFADAGSWDYTHPTLCMRVRGVGTLTYTLVTGEGERLVQWRRTKLEPDASGAAAAATEEARQSAALANLMMGAAMNIMEGRTVQWQRVPAAGMFPSAR